MKLKQFNNFDKKETNEDFNIEMLDSFTKNYSEFSSNLTKSKLFLEQFESLAEEIKTLVKKEEFETTLASHVIVINETISNIKQSLKDIKEDNVTLVNENAKGITFKLKEVVDLLNEELKTHKKFIHETNTKNKTVIDGVLDAVSKIDTEYVDQRMNQFEGKVIDITEKFNKEIPKNKREFNEYVFENNKKVEELRKSQEVSVGVISNELSDVDTKIGQVRESVEEINNNLPKLKKEILSSSSKLEKKLKEDINFVKTKFEEEINYKEKQIVESLTSSIDEKQIQIDKINEDLPKQKSRVLDVELDIKKALNEISDIKKDTSLIEKFNEIKTDVQSIDMLVEDNNNKIKNVEKDVRTALSKITNVLSEEKYLAINKKIKHMEEVLEKFNEKQILTENIYPDPVTKTADPLTPLDQNFVTFEQLKKHYSLFINRVQNSLMAVGGGGAGYLPDLMDVAIASTPADGNVLKYVSANAKWEAGVVSAGVSYDQDLNTTNNVTFANVTATGDLVVTGDLSVLGNSTILNTSTIVSEDKNILLANGAASAAVADGAGITVDGAQANITYLNSNDRWSFNKTIEVNGEPVITFNNTFSLEANDSITIAYTDGSTSESVFAAEQGQASISIIDSGTPGAKLQLNLSNVVINNGQGSNPIDLEVSGNVVVGGNVIVDESITANGTITSPYFYSESDITLKDDIQPIDGALEKVLNLFGVSFKWKTNQTKSIGVIAQQVEKVIPEIVSSSAGKKTVSYDAMIPLLIEAIKEQQEQINELKSRLNEKH